MGKKAALPRMRSQPRTVNQAKARRQEIASTIAELDQLEPTTAKAKQALALLRSWLADESGYDEKAWPRLKKALEKERQYVGAEGLFDG